MIIPELFPNLADENLGIPFFINDFNEIDPDCVNEMLYQLS